MTSLADLDIDKVCPGIVGNPYLGGNFPGPKQALFLAAHLPYAHLKDVFQAFYGGAAGGGKSIALLMACAQQAHLYPGSSSIMMRRTFTESDEEGALLAEAKKWWLPVGVHWNGHKFIFPNGSAVSVGYYTHDNDAARYHSAAYQLVVFDELTFWENVKAYDTLLSRIRRASWMEEKGFPLRLLCASNPGSVGHLWVKEKFITGYRDKNTGEWVEPLPFYPAKLQDNIYADREAYMRTLMRLTSPTRRDQLLQGNWDARDPGDYYQWEWFGPLLDEAPAGDYYEVRAWDLAASEKDDAAWTVGVKMRKYVSGVRVVAHVESFRLTPGKRDDRIVQTAILDGPKCTQHIEQEPGSGGIAQAFNLSQRLKRDAKCRTDYKPPTMPKALHERERLLQLNPIHERGKAGRAVPVSSCLYRGYVRRGESPDEDEPDWGVDQGRPPSMQRDGIRLVAGEWTQTYLDKLEGFPETGLDESDATVAAWVFLETHAFPHMPRLGHKTRPNVDSLDLHPAEREELERNEGKDAGGRWLP